MSSSAPVSHTRHVHVCVSQHVVVEPKTSVVARRYILGEDLLRSGCIKVDFCAGHEHDVTMDDELDERATSTALTTWALAMRWTSERATARIV